MDIESGHLKRCAKLGGENGDAASMDIDECKLILRRFILISFSAKIFSTSKKSSAPATNSFVFKEYGIQLVTDYESKAELAELPENCDEDEEEESDMEAEETDDFQREQQKMMKDLSEKLKKEGVTFKQMITSYSILPFSDHRRRFR